MLSAIAVSEPLLPPKSREPETVTTSIRIKREAIDRLDEIAAAEGYSRNELIVHAINRFLSDYSAAKGKPQRKS